MTSTPRDPAAPNEWEELVPFDRERILWRMMEKGVSVRGLAKKAKVNPQTLHNALGGGSRRQSHRPRKRQSHRLRKDVLARIARVLGRSQRHLRGEGPDSLDQAFVAYLRTEGIRELRRGTGARTRYPKDRAGFAVVRALDAVTGDAGPLRFQRMVFWMKYASPFSWRCLIAGTSRIPRRSPKKELLRFAIAMQRIIEIIVAPWREKHRTAPRLAAFERDLYQLVAKWEGQKTAG